MLLIFVDVDELKESHTNYTRHKKASYTYPFPSPNNTILSPRRNKITRFAVLTMCLPILRRRAGPGRRKLPQPKQTPRAWIRTVPYIQPHIRKWADVNLSSGAFPPPDFSSSEGALQSPQYGLNSGSFGVHVDGRIMPHSAPQKPSDF